MNVDLLRSTWRAASRNPRFATHFYGTLFARHPEAKALFPAHMAKQRRKILRALGTVVANVDRLDQAIPMLDQLGRDHRRFEAQPAHYAAVGDALLATLDYFLADEWTTEMAQTWSAAYQVVADVMKRAAAAAEAMGIPAWWDAKVVEVSHRGDDARLIVDVPRFPEHPKPVLVEVALARQPGTWHRVDLDPVDGHRYAITVTLTDDPVTLTLHHVMPGDALRLSAPLDRVDPFREDR